jgi:acetyl-CoA acetyltransferase
MFTAAEFALIARRHMEVYGTTREQLSIVAATIRNNGSTNPEAVYAGRGPFTPDDITASRMVADPFHLLDCATTSEGGCALVIANVDRLDPACRPVHVLGSGADFFGPSYQHPPAWDITGRRGEHPNGLVGRHAADMAFAHAGIGRDDVDVLELYDPFSFEIIRQLEAFRFCPDGEGGPFVQDGHIANTGSHPVTTDGGTMSFSHAGTNPQMMQRAIRGVQQLRGDAGPLQVPNARIALCSNGGAGALFTTVLLLGDEPR